MRLIRVQLIPKIDGTARAEQSLAIKTCKPLRAVMLTWLAPLATKHGLGPDGNDPGHTFGGNSAMSNNATKVKTAIAELALRSRPCSRLTRRWFGRSTIESKRRECMPWMSEFLLRLAPDLGPPASFQSRPASRLSSGRDGAPTSYRRRKAPSKGKGHDKVGAKEMSQRGAACLTLLGQ